MSFAFVFPGQGSQSVGMLGGARRGASRSIGATFAEASEALGYDLWKLVERGPGGASSTPPSARSRRCWPPASRPGACGAPRRRRCRRWSPGTAWGSSPRWCAPGRWSSRRRSSWCAFAGRSCRRRCRPAAGRWRRSSGSRMRTSRRPAGRPRRARWSKPANFNSPGQVVIAGQAAAVRARDRGRARRAAPSARVLLPVSVPAHSSLMRRRAERLRERLQGPERAHARRSAT